MGKLTVVNKAGSVFKRLFTKRRVLVVGIGIAAFLVITPIATYSHFEQDIADRGRLMNRESTGIIIRDRHGEVLYSYGQLPTQPDVKLHQISDNLEQAVLASEDQGFYNHEGYSLRGIARALYANLRNQDPTLYGGSTVTQQLVKNKLLGSSKNYYRKYHEIIMAVAIERRYNKEQIMEMYLNSVYFGEGAFGVSSAAKTYFNKSAQDLTIAESAMLVGLLPAPSVYSPTSGEEKLAKQHQKRVLKRMAEAGYIPKKEVDKQAGIKLAYAPQSKSEHPHAQHFVMMVLDDIKSKYGEENVTRAGYDVTTTLDLKWQKQAEAELREKIEKIKHFGASNASLVAIDPKSGEVRALVGSADWNNPQFGRVNMAITPRQPGSSFKPIYYTEALDKKLITAATVVKDEARAYGNWEPSNYDFRYRGDITIRNALAQSLNMPAIEVMQKLSPETASDAAQRMQISTVNEPQKYGLTLALGTAEVRVLDMTNAYAALANRGQQYDAGLVSSIENKYDKKVFTAERKVRKVTSPEASFLISSILSDDQARAPTFGGKLTIDGQQVAAKTGTTNDSKDAWTIGYTPNLSVGVWVGNNQHQPMQGLSGSSSAGAIWRNTMRSILETQPKETFNPTSAIVHSEVCDLPGLSPWKRDAIKEYFIKGTEPKNCQIKPEAKEQKEPEKRREEEKKPEEKPPKPEDVNSGGRGGGTGSGIPGDIKPEEPPKEEEKPKPEEPTEGETTTSG